MRKVNISSIYPEILDACHDELRRHFEPMITVTQALPEVQVLTSLTLRLVRLAKATTLLCGAGLKEESQLQLRSASESVVNLLYIMYAGPMTEAKLRTDLARQFLAYGDVAYCKMLKRRPDSARKAFKKQGMSDADIDNFIVEKQRLADDALKTHGCEKSRWHRLTLVDMADRVRNNAPAFVDEDFAEYAFSSFVSTNSATHADALSLRSQYKELGNAPLEVVLNRDHSSADMVGNQAIWAWRALADYYGQMDFVDQCLERHSRDLLGKRYNSSPDDAPTQAG